MAKIKLDLHDIYNKGRLIDLELDRVIGEAVAKKIALVEIVSGKGKGELKKHVLRFLAQPKIARLYHRVEKDDKNFGRIFVHFRHRSKRDFNRFVDK
jgi:DNA-nicking Smr family endonuclease